MSNPDTPTPTTVELCNQVLATVREIEAAVRELTLMLPTTDSLQRMSAIIIWCKDARGIVLEIKSHV